MGCRNCESTPPPIPEELEPEGREGNQLTDQICPQCSSPLGRSEKGELVIFWCSNVECDYRVGNL